MAEHATDPVGEWLTRFASAHPGAEVLDVGGGSGTRAVPLARAGCTVLVVDSSTDALASLARRAADAGVSDRITGVQADADQLGAVRPADSADLVLYHHVVQDVDDPRRSLAAAAAIVRPGGSVSVLVPGRLSTVLGAVLSGQRDAAVEALDADPGTDRRYDVPALRGLVEGAGLIVQGVTGVGILSSLAGYTGRAAAVAGSEWGELELRLRQHPVLGQIAGDLHAVGLRPEA